MLLKEKMIGDEERLLESSHLPIKPPNTFGTPLLQRHVTTIPPPARIVPPRGPFPKSLPLRFFLYIILRIILSKKKYDPFCQRLCPLIFSRVKCQGFFFFELVKCQGLHQLYVYLYI